MYVTVVECLKVAPLKIQHDNIAVNFSNSTCFCTFPCTDRKTYRKFFLTHKAGQLVAGNIQLYCL